MRKLGILFVLAAMLGMVAVACGDDDNGKNACEKAADVAKAGMDDYCNGKADTCWFCDCYLKGQVMDMTVDGTNITYSCKAPDPASTTCDGSALDSANSCLANESACQSTASSTAEQACNSSSK